MGQSMVISKGSTTKKVMALTFDDGSDAANLAEQLDILASHNLTCTFFLTGKATEAHPALIRKIVEQGHEIGNHSYSHPEFTQITVATMETELRKAENAIIAITGVSPRPLFRPPYGAYNQTVLEVVGNLGYTKTLMWTIDTVDWNGTSAEAMIEKVLDRAQPGAIVLMHTGGGTHTNEALPKMITGLKSMGYTLTTISKMLEETTEIRPVLRRGSTGTFVEELQQALTRLGFKPGIIDGIYGQLTETAVKAFQTSKGLVVDGIVGPKTWNALKDAMETPPPVTRPTLRRGSSGAAVIDLQQALSALGFDPGTIDGIFGTRTEAAVKLFQKAKGLVVDGIVGAKTWAAIDGGM